MNMSFTLQKKRLVGVKKRSSNSCWNYELTQSFRCSYSGDDDTRLMVMTTEFLGRSSNPMIRGQKWSPTQMFELHLLNSTAV